MFLSFDMLCVFCVFYVYVLCVVLSVGETDLLTSYTNKNLESWILNRESSYLSIWRYQMYYDFIKLMFFSWKEYFHFVGYDA